MSIAPPKRLSYGRWLATDTLDGRRGRGDGRIIVEDDRVTAWNWRTGQKSTVWLRDAREDRRQFAERCASQREDRRQRAVRAAQIARRLVSGAALDTHPYLAAKGFRDERTLTIPVTKVADIAGAYLVPNGGEAAIVIPARRGDRIVSAQLIWENGDKKFLAGGEIGGTSHRVATGRDTWVCEGFATALSLRAALMGLSRIGTILCAFSASNLSVVARRVTRGRCYLVADNDRPLDQFGGIGAGEHYARAAGRPYLMPPDVGTDINDLHRRSGIFAVQRLVLRFLKELA